MSLHLSQETIQFASRFFLEACGHPTRTHHPHGTFFSGRSHFSEPSRMHIQAALQPMSLAVRG